MKFQFVQGMPNVPRSREEEAEEKMAQEAEMMHMRVQGRGRPALDEYQSMPMEGDEDSPEMHQALMARGRGIAGDFDGLDQIGGAAVEARRRMQAPPAQDPMRQSGSGIPTSYDEAMAMRGDRSAGGRDGIDQIGDYASQLMERARAQSAMRQRGGRGR